MQPRRFCGLVAIAVLLATSLLAGCAPRPSSRGSRDEVVIGAALPLSGALASFGGFQKWGYEHAVAEANRAGGLLVGGKRMKVRLILRDDRSDPNVTSSDIDSLVSSDHVNALLGSCTPPLVIPGGLAAERAQIPMVTGCAPIVAFTSAKRWRWVWDLFFNETEVAELPFKLLRDDGVATNRRIAILHDNGPDGAVVGGKLWPQFAQAYGYTVAANIVFPTDTTNFDAGVQQLKAAGADIVLIDAVTPQAVSIRKQMAAAGVGAKVLVVEKGAEPAQYATALGSLAEGSLVAGYWDPSFPYPGAKALGDAFLAETGASESQHIADSYTAAKVLLDAIQRASSLDPDRLNDAIGKTNAVYPVGRIVFAANHTAALAVAEMQWQGGQIRVVWPAARANARLIAPSPAP
jgi:branched-chain amino acid transport system substrate-binding protein